MAQLKSKGTFLPCYKKTKHISNVGCFETSQFVFGVIVTIGIVCKICAKTQAGEIPFIYLPSNVSGGTLGLENRVTK